MSISMKLTAAAALLGAATIGHAATVQSYHSNSGGEWGVQYYTQIDLDTLGSGVEGTDFNVKYNGWENLAGASGIAATYTTTGVKSQQGSSADNNDSPLLRRSSASGHYPATMGFYSFGTDSTFQISELNPLADVSTIYFQVVLGETRVPYSSDPNDGDFVPPEHWVDADGNPSNVAVYPIADDNFSFGGAAPVLTINGDTAAALAGTAVGFTQHHGVSSSVGIVTLNEYLFAWDVSELGQIDSFTVDFGVRVHALFPEVALYQTDYTEPQDNTPVVPEPATASLLVLGGLALISRRRRQA